MKVIINLSCYDYSEGPIVDALNNQGEMWVFGKDVRRNEVDIKITLGKPNVHTICISLHKAEHPMSYPLNPHSHKATFETAVITLIEPVFEK